MWHISVITREGRQRKREIEKASERGRLLCRIERGRQTERERERIYRDR